MSRPSPFSKSASASRPIHFFETVGDAAECRDDLDDRREDVLRLAARGRRQLDAVAHELAAVDVDDGPLDAGAADVDSECSCHASIFLQATVSTSAPRSVTTRVCSN
jgi:hypothetical protein